MPLAANRVERAALAVAALVAFLSPFMGSAVNLALPAMAADLHLDAVALGWVPTSFLLAAAVFLVPMGRLADIHGRRRLLAWGVAVFTLASLGCASAGSAAALLAGRVCQGFGSAMVFGTSIAVLASVFPAERRGAALGINAAAVYVGLCLGPFAGGAMTERLGWRSVFVAAALVGAATGVVLWRGLRGEWAESPGEPFDWVGALLYGVSLSALMYGLSVLPEPWGAVPILAGLALLVAFVGFEASRTSPVLDVSLFRSSRGFALANLAALVSHASTFAVPFLISLYLAYARGFGPEAAGLLLLAQPVVMALVSPLAGRLSDRVQVRWVASAGSAAMVLGLLGLARLDAHTPLGTIVAWLAVSGLGFGLFSPPNTSAAMGAVPRRHYGTAAAMVATMRLTGQMLSMGLVLIVLAAHVGPTQLTSQQVPGLLVAARTAFSAFAVLCGVGTVASLARGAGSESP